MVPFAVIVTGDQSPKITLASPQSTWHDLLQRVLEQRRADHYFVVQSFLFEKEEDAGNSGVFSRGTKASGLIFLLATDNNGNRVFAVRAILRQGNRVEFGDTMGIHGEYEYKFSSTPYFGLPNVKVDWAPTRW